MGLDDYMKYLNDRDSSQHRQSVINVLKNRAFLSQFMRSVIRFTDDNIRVALQRQQFEENKDNLNIRASVESTVRSVIHPFGGHLCKLPVRGKERIKTMVILGTAMVDRKSTRLNSSHTDISRMPSSA